MLIPALANVIQLNANINVVQANVAAIIDGTTAFTDAVTMNDDLIVTGNLIVNGETTTANSVNMVVQDRMLMLANSATGAPAADVGIFLIEEIKVMLPFSMMSQVRLLKYLILKTHQLT